MTNLVSGYLFKKRYVTYKQKEHEVFELVDYVAGINFTNRNKENLCNILSGDYSGTYASILNPNILTRNSLEGQYVFCAYDIERAASDNGNSVEFASIRKVCLMGKVKYYKRNWNGSNLAELKDRDLLSYIESLKEDSSKEQVDGEPDEENKEKPHKTTDISSIYAEIKKTVISQDRPIMQILTSIFKNQLLVNSNLSMDYVTKLKENILVFGPTGTGKTEILTRISKIYGIPIVIEDATDFSETGYDGRNVTEMLEDLCSAAEGDIEKAEKGVLVIDEFDKLAERDDRESHVSKIGVQRSLLKLCESSVYYLDDKRFDTSRLTVVVLGAFTGIIDGDDYSKIKPEDFDRYGILSELIGRFPKPVPMNPLSKKDMIRILKESNFSPLNTYRKLFELLNVDFKFSDGFIDFLADAAIAKKSGARGIKTAFDECVSDALFSIFAGESSSISLIKPDEKTGKAFILKPKKERRSLSGKQ